MDCPNCGLVSPETAQRCDCGYDFRERAVIATFAPQPSKYDWDKLGTDALVGVAALALVIPAAMLSGGFVFYQPWVVFTVLFMFVAGFIRGGRAAIAWPIGLAIGAGTWGILFLCARFDPLVCVVVTLITSPPAFAGVLTRRYVRSRMKRHSTDG